jgi:uncharacterized membrane protein YdbT with pleckstrin-like domain
MTMHLLLGLPIAGALVLWLDWTGALLGAAVLAFCAARARRAARVIAWSPTDWGVAGRQGAFATSVSYTFHDRVQTAAVVSSPLDRRHDHATLRVDTAGGTKTGHPLHLRYLRRGDAERLRETLVRRVSGTRFRW